MTGPIKKYTAHDVSVMTLYQLGEALLCNLNLLSSAGMEWLTNNGGYVTGEWTEAEGVAGGKCIVTARGPGGAKLAVMSLMKKTALGILVGTVWSKSGSWAWARKKVAGIIMEAVSEMKAEAAAGKTLKTKTHTSVKPGNPITTDMLKSVIEDLSMPKESVIFEDKAIVADVNLSPAAQAEEDAVAEKYGFAPSLLKDVSKIAKVLNQGADTEEEANAQGGEDVATFLFAKLQTEPPVPLGKATMLYEPVCGTSPGSRYFALGVSASLNVGVRYQDHTMAIRIEGSLLGSPEARAALKKFGFSNVSEKYGSMHLGTGGEETMARKLLGSVLMGLGMEWQHPLPDLSVIHGKGQ